MKKASFSLFIDRLFKFWVKHTVVIYADELCTGWLALRNFCGLSTAPLHTCTTSRSNVISFKCAVFQLLQTVESWFMLPWMSSASLLLCLLRLIRIWQACRRYSWGYGLFLPFALHCYGAWGKKNLSVLQTQHWLKLWGTEQQLLNLIYSKQCFYPGNLAAHECVVGSSLSSSHGWNWNLLSYCCVPSYANASLAHGNV